MSSYPIAIEASVVRTRGELGTGALKMKFRDTKKLISCSYCACLNRQHQVMQVVKAAQCFATPSKKQQ